jgi:hypothetical protein
MRAAAPQHRTDGRLTALNAAPELLLGREQEVLVKRIGRNGDLDPFAAARDNRKHRGRGIHYPHVVLKLRHVLFGRPFLRKRPREHELGLEDGTRRLNHPVKRRCHPLDHGVVHPPLHVLDGLSGISLEPSPIEVYRSRSGLDNEVAGEVIWHDLAALLLPEIA